MKEHVFFIFVVALCICIANALIIPLNITYQHRPIKEALENSYTQ